MLDHVMKTARRDGAPPAAAATERSMSDTGVLQRLGDAQKVIAKWCQPRALALPDIKARLRT